MTIFKTALALAAMACVALPAAAQSEPEQDRTTWRILLVNLKDDAGDGWETIMMEKVLPAYAAAGLPVPQLHWSVMSDWEMVLISEVPGGMATFDTHNPAARAALNAALVDSLGSEEAVAAMYAELGGYVEDSDTIFTHTHP